MDTLSGLATFASMEQWVHVDVEGDGRGHFLARCTVRDEPGKGNTLTFELRFDQTEIPQMLRDLDQLMHALPVKGDLGRG